MEIYILVDVDFTEDGREIETILDVFDSYEKAKNTEFAILDNEDEWFNLRIKNYWVN